MDSEQGLVFEEEEEDVNRDVYSALREKAVSTGDEEPEWACKYCGIADPASVVRCLETGFWFCNSRGSSSGSHIVHHLVKSSKKEICLHPESPLGETIVECYNCSNRNVFMMGFIPAKGESVVVLLCRTCLQEGALKELGWDMDSWTSLVCDKELRPWLVKVPSEEDQLKARNISTAQINLLEEAWKKNPNADGVNLEAQALEEEEIAHVQRVYEDGYSYQNIYSPLVNLEAECDRDMKDNLKQENVCVTWKTSVANKGVATATFKPGTSMTEGGRLAIGDELRLNLGKHVVDGSFFNKALLISANKKKMRGAPDSKKKKDWDQSGTIIHIDDDDTITLEFRGSAGSIPTHIESGFQVSYVWKPITFDRMQNAMTKFAVDDKSVSGYLYHKLLGHMIEDQLRDTNIPAKWAVKGLPELNQSQLKAIREALVKPLALIQGPPGTGKTVTSASLVYHMVKQNKAKVLVTAPSNVAVDQLTEKIHKTGLKVVRLVAKAREHLESNVEELTLHYTIKNFAAATGGDLKRLLDKKEEVGYLSDGETKKLVKLLRSTQNSILNDADVICCTCAGAGDPRLSSMKFEHVLLDEATQATEPESLIPLVMGCQQFILVGDHCQLGPVVMCKKAATAGLSTSLFERLVTNGLRPLRLTTQYRMHPCLSEFPSTTFYEGSLMNGVSDIERTATNVQFPWPDPKKPMFFYSCNGQEELAGTGTSYLNRTEASNCEKVVTSLLKGGAAPEQIGVVTPYEGQRAYIVSHMQRHGSLKNHLYKDVEISSVDAFQGREKDYIILSCVRSNEKQGIGFLKDPRRLNVALTRAKYGLVILGSPKVLVEYPLWRTLIGHFHDASLLMDGALNNLQESRMSLGKPKKYYRDRRQRLFDEHAAQVFSGDVSDPYGDRKASKKALAEDSRFDPRYGGATHIQPTPEAAAGDILNSPVLPIPTMNVPSHVQVPPPVSHPRSDNLPMYRGYGDFDYNTYNTTEIQSVLDSLQTGTDQPSMLGTQAQIGGYTQESHGRHPMTQAGGGMSQSQFMLTQQQSTQLSNANTQSQYLFQDEDGCDEPY
uniref:Upf1 domain-containing protein n=1 Tax=Mucochytrium quahogii TaxID=96639 RepID=A0A7S2RGG5_9STRA|mmetsp:Transcript_20006/g.32995  ORF Transcript_20006/g.32995 Transcript_20006/m.32995 type:complete len:1059 (-) Transcript_20006:1311-4487(-)